MHLYGKNVEERGLWNTCEAGVVQGSTKGMLNWKLIFFLSKQEGPVVTLSRVAICVIVSLVAILSYHSAGKEWEGAFLGLQSFSAAY